MTYNANLDKSLAQRKSPAELRAELKRWEELQEANAKKRECVGEDVVRYQVCVCVLFF
jgi:E3 ubiquitin-protein ligase RAD18